MEAGPKVATSLAFLHRLMRLFSPRVLASEQLSWCQRPCMCSDSYPPIWLSLFNSSVCSKTRDNVSFSFFSFHSPFWRPLRSCCFRLLCFIVIKDPMQIILRTTALSPVWLGYHGASCSQSNRSDKNRRRDHLLLITLAQVLVASGQNQPVWSWIYKTCSFSILLWSENSVHCSNKSWKKGGDIMNGPLARLFILPLNLVFPSLRGRCRCGCPGNTATMITASFSRLKPRTVTREEDKLGREPSPGKSTLTPSLLVPSPDMSPHMAGERALVSEDISVIFHIITSANLKMTWKSAPERMVKKKTPKKPHTIGWHCGITCRINVTFYTLSQRLKAPARLINEEEKVWISMREPRKTKRNNKYSVQVNGH